MVAKDGFHVGKERLVGQFRRLVNGERHGCPPIGWAEGNVVRRQGAVLNRPEDSRVAPLHEIANLAQTVGAIGCRYGKLGLIEFEIAFRGKDAVAAVDFFLPHVPR